MASIPTASVDALVHVNAYGDRKTARGCSLSAQVEWCKLDQVVRFIIVQSVADCRDHETISVIWALFAVSIFRSRASAEDVEMSDKSMNTRVGRNVALAACASLALVAASISPSAAASPAPAKATAAAVAGQGSSNATDFSAARRRHYYRRGPNAAGLAFMGVAAGLIGGAIAESRRQEYYDNYYYGGPRYYGPGPGYGYYGGPRYDYNPY